MENWKRSQGGNRLLWLGVTVGLVTLCLAILWWVSASRAPAVAAPVAGRRDEAPSNGTVITIGVGVRLSGPAEGLGWQEANSVQLAISQTNAAGGVDIGGVAYTVTLVLADSGCNPAQAVTAANDLLDAGAVAVVGHTCSSAAFAAQPIYNAAGVPMIMPSATDTELT